MDIGKTQDVRGLPCPYNYRYKRQNLEDAMDYKAKDNDLVFLSYPKTGITWLQYIVLQIISKGNFFPTFDELNSKIVPLVELTGIAALERASENTLFRTHLPCNMIKINSKAKYLYTYRYPEDVVVSFHRFVNSMSPDYPNEFDDFFENFMKGKTAYGCYFQHVLSCYAHQKDTNLLMISYEKLHANTKDEILRIAAFLGEKYHQNLVEDSNLLKKILENTSFKHMKEKVLIKLHYSKYMFGSEVEKDQMVIPFCRKGIVGDGKNVLTDSQRIRVQEKIEKMMEGTSIGEEWKKYSLTHS